MTERLTGTVTRTISDKGFGFIAVPTGHEYFFHKSACSLECRDAQDFLTLIAGDRVSFEPTIGPKGARAESVRLEVLGATTR
jgi:cold shock CspA family protein